MTQKVTHTTLRRRLKNAEKALDVLESEIQLEIRDIPSLESYAEGYLDDDERPFCRVRSDLRTFIASLVERYPAVRAYVGALRRKLQIEALIEADLTCGVRIPTEQEASTVH